MGKKADCANQYPYGIPYWKMLPEDIKHIDVIFIHLIFPFGLELHYHKWFSKITISCISEH